MPVCPLTPERTKPGKGREGRKGDWRGGDPGVYKGEGGEREGCWAFVEEDAGSNRVAHCSLDLECVHFFSGIFPRLPPEVVMLEDPPQPSPHYRISSKGSAMPVTYNYSVQNSAIANLLCKQASF